MSSTDTFDLEPEQEQPPLDWQAAVDDGEHTDPTLPPPRAGLRRRRQRNAASEGAVAPGEPAPTGKARYLRWLISPTFYYVVALLSALGMLFVFFNPTFGTVSRAWWFDVLRENGPWLYKSEAAGTAAALLLCVVGATVGLWLKRWRYRPAFMVLMFSLPFFAPGSMLWGMLIGYWTFPAALLGGVLLSAARRHRRGHLLAAILVLGGMLFVPTVANYSAWRQPAWDYGNAAANSPRDHASYHSPARRVFDKLDSLEGPSKWGGLARVGLVFGMLALGLLAWMGLGGAWVPWGAGALLFLGFTLGSGLLVSEWDGWQASVSAWADAYYGRALSLLLPLAAAVSEMRAPRDR